MNLFKKILAAVLITGLSAVLTACGGGGNNGGSSAASSLTKYEGGEFTINIDPTWKIINSSEFYADIPQETVVAFTTPEAFDGFFINVNVLKEDLGQSVSALDYARANINLAAQNLTDYQKVQEANIQVGGENSLIHIFQARLNPSEKLIRFIQLYATRGNYGYIVTGGMLPTTPKEIRDEVGASVTSFSLR